MKKDKLKKLVKSARKTAGKDIRASLVTELKEVTGKLGQTSKKLEKEIEKGAKQLAKKLSKEINIDKSALQNTANEAKAAIVPKTAKPVASKVKTKPSKPATPAVAKAKPAKEEAPTA